MRIISQNGTIDVPYDMCCVWRQEEVIYCRVFGNDDNILMAAYSSSETAEMVLERFKDNALALLLDLLVERIIPKGGKLPLSDIYRNRKDFSNENCKSL